MLNNAPILVIGGVDTAEYEHLEVWRCLTHLVIRLLCVEAHDTGASARGAGVSHLEENISRHRRAAQKRADDFASRLRT